MNWFLGTSTYYCYNHNWLYVIEFWKTDQIITLGLLHFIGHTNGYTRTLHIHSVSIRLG